MTSRLLAVTVMAFCLGYSTANRTWQWAVFFAFSSLLWFVDALTYEAGSEGAKATKAEGGDK